MKVMKAYADAAKISQDAPQPPAALEVTMKSLTLTMAQHAAQLPEYYWMTALPQLVSRICHRHPEVLGVVEVCSA